MNLNTKKATGPDEIPAFILKAAATELAPALANLFQLSLDLGEVPQDWREASVVPLFQERRPPPSIQLQTSVLDVHNVQTTGAHSA